MSASKKLRLNAEEAVVTKKDTTPKEYRHKTSAEEEGSSLPITSDPTTATKKSAVINFDTELVAKLQGNPFIPASNGKLDRLWWRPITVSPSIKSGFADLVVSCFLLGGATPARPLFDPYVSDETLYGYPATFRVNTDDLLAMGYSLHCLNYGCTGSRHMIFASDIESWKCVLKKKFQADPVLKSTPEKFPSWAFKHELDHLTEVLDDKQIVLMRKVLESKEYSSTWGVRQSRTSFKVDLPAKKIMYYFSSFILTRKLPCVRTSGGDYAFTPFTTLKVDPERELEESDGDDEIVEVSSDKANRSYFYDSENDDVLESPFPVK